uniref:Uncharacterized protein n=1 Tax=Scleropages formosus TaxID=113540 RepID=A0A8C9RD02_SCLFO
MTSGYFQLHLQISKKLIIQIRSSPSLLWPLPALQYPVQIITLLKGTTARGEIETCDLWIQRQQC